VRPNPLGVQMYGARPRYDALTMFAEIAFLLLMAFFFVSDAFISLGYPNSIEADCASAIFIGAAIQTTTAKAAVIIPLDKFEACITLHFSMVCSPRRE
jgi:hypothetical protein